MLAVVGNKTISKLGVNAEADQKELMKFMRLLVFVAYSKNERRKLRSHYLDLNNDDIDVLMKDIEFFVQEYETLRKSEPDRLDIAKENIKYYQHEITMML